MKIHILLIALASAGLIAHAEETYYWVNENGGAWNEPTNWRIGSRTGAVATDYPKEYDTVRFETSGEYDVSLSEDVTVDKFYFWHTGTKTVRMLMNGHLLRAKTYFNHRSGLVKDNSPSLITYVGGELTCDAPPASKSGVAYAGFFVDGEGNSGTERGLMNLSGSTLSLTNNFGINGNQSEVFLGNQSTCQVSRTMSKNITVNGSSRVFVDRSHVESYMFNLNASSTAEFRNGATFEIGGLFVNGGTTYPRVTINCSTGTLYTANASGNAGSIRLNSGGAAHNSYLLITNHAQVICNARVTVGSYNGNTTSPCGQTNGWLVVADGSLLDSYAHNEFQQVGQNKGCLCHLAVDDATVRFSRLQIGNQTTSTNNVLHISGRHPLLKCERATTAKSGDILKGAALVACATSSFDFTIPADGYVESPVQITGFLQTLASKQAGLMEEKVHLTLEADAFARSNPGVTLPLITATEDSSAAYRELIENFTYGGKERYKGVLSVSADGKTLSYTTPKKVKGLVFLVL